MIFASRFSMAVAIRSHAAACRSTALTCRSVSASNLSKIAWISAAPGMPRLANTSVDDTDDGAFCVERRLLGVAAVPSVGVVVVVLPRMSMTSLMGSMPTTLTIGRKG